MPEIWQQELARAYRSPSALLDELGLSPAAVGLDSEACEDFAFRVTRPFAARMRRADPLDPLLLQVLPRGEEKLAAAGYSSDPLDEQARTHGSVLTKYAGRALLVTTAACAIHCRYCFRRSFPYARHVGDEALSVAMDAIRGDSALSEIILSGGDPLMLDNTRLAAILTTLADVPHLSTLRIHTRFPVVLPERIDGGLLRALDTSRLAVVLVTHINHAQEIDAATRAALQALQSAGVILLNQGVLLRGINDTLLCQAALSKRLLSSAVLPYYMHQLDPIAGAAHFSVDDDAALRLERELRAQLPGYLVPRFVREVPDAKSKLPLAELSNSLDGLGSLA